MTRRKNTRGMIVRNHHGRCLVGYAVKRQLYLDKGRRNDPWPASECKVIEELERALAESIH